MYKLASRNFSSIEGYSLEISSFSSFDSRRERREERGVRERRKREGKKELWPEKNYDDVPKYVRKRNTFIGFLSLFFLLSFSIPSSFSLERKNHEGERKILIPRFISFSVRSKNKYFKAFSSLFSLSLSISSILSTHN